jgi:hypothetical protein
MIKHFIHVHLLAVFCSNPWNAPRRGGRDLTWSFIFHQHNALQVKTRKSEFTRLFTVSTDNFSCIRALEVYYEITKLLNTGATDLTNLRNCKKVLSREDLYRQRARMYYRLKNRYRRVLCASLRETRAICRMWPLI